ncbi:hypothetical protein K4F52_000541 [Lecanicillium sp. MT-2017a]|nr:hypothetical protein K4F52_000541 [Lecanicillium sp. MT-2017a]
MKSYKAPLPKPPPSVHDRPWDPWNSSSTGHQRREVSRGESNPGETETSWRNRRNRMINQQFRQSSGQGNNAATPAQDEHLLPKPSVVEMLVRPGKMRESMGLSDKSKESIQTDANPVPAAGRRIFDGLVIYVNGSTFPLISDHKLKKLLCENGAHMSLHLGRRRVTHVILGRATASSDYSTLGAASHHQRSTATAAAAAAAASSASAPSLVGSAGGGLAGRKMEKEIRRVGGCGIKYVGVEW